LVEDESGARGQVYLTVLLVAECAAKVIYNASGVTDYDEPAPFDDDCGAWLITNLRHLVRACDSPEFAQQAWAVLESWLRRVPSTAEPLSGSAN
jgi:hypothetical protein